MKCFSPRGAVASLLVLAAAALAAQVPTQQVPAPQTTHSGGQVIFSRSLDENGQTHNGPASDQPAAPAVAPLATDAERQSVTLSDWNLDVHLQPATSQIVVRARFTARNTGSAPLAHIPLQISSSLNWERIRIGDSNARFQTATLNSDADHTGQLHEAALILSQPLAPGQSLSLDATYSGTISPSAQRLLAIGTPDDVARHADWDRIGQEFTGLRGFGNVVWTPVVSLPVMLGDGARLFDEVGAQKLRHCGASFRLHLTVEFPHGQAPTVAVVNGQPVPLTVTESGQLDPNQEVASVATASVTSSVLGFETPSLFLAQRVTHSGPNLTAWATEDDAVSSTLWTEAAQAVSPLLQSWLGTNPRSQLVLLDLPDAEDAPFETGSLLAAPLRTQPADQLNGILAHALTHAYLRSATQAPRPWLDEGVATFLGSLWVEQKHGREAALGVLDAGRAALALAEPESPGQHTGQPIPQATAPAFYRTKAAYLFWMLRDTVGDAALSTAFRNYDPSQSASFQSVLEKAAAQDLSWFFADWVDADKGLPEIAVEGAFPAPGQAGTWIVAVNLANNGYAAAEVPVTVFFGQKSVTERLRVPARSKASQRILVQGKPREVRINDGSVPETTTGIVRLPLDDAPPPAAR